LGSWSRESKQTRVPDCTAPAVTLKRSDLNRKSVLVAGIDGIVEERESINNLLWHRREERESEQMVKTLGHQHIERALNLA